MKILMLLLLTAALPLSAEIYRYVDDDGNVVFTDSPPASKPSEKVDVGEPTTSPAFRPSPISNVAQDPPSNEAINYSAALTPPNGVTIRANGGMITAQVTLQPASKNPVESRFYVDGNLKTSSDGLSAELIGIDRGEHTLYAEVYDKTTGTLLATTPHSDIMLLRASLLLQKQRDASKKANTASN